MKKFWIVFPVLLLLCAGMVMMSCPSDPVDPNTTGPTGPTNPTDPTNPNQYPDLLLAGGKYQYVFTTPKIEQGKKYQVIFTIDECDSSFINSYLGGKICYKMDFEDKDETDKLLSGWLNSAPVQVTASVKTYKWTFEAGKKNSDSLNVENPATTPEGATQYFAFTAQDKDWKDYASTVNFNVKGKFEVKAVITITNWVSEGTVTLGNDQGTAGKGALSEADMTRIRALPPDSVIEITVSVTVNTSDARPGYGVCSVGGWDTNNSMSISIPGDAKTGLLVFTEKLPIADLLGLQPEGYQIAINPYNGATVTKAELFKPGP
jgi:hypothetical protein